jgi:hypothetical protein
MPLNFIEIELRTYWAHGVYYIVEAWMLINNKYVASMTNENPTAEGRPIYFTVKGHGKFDGHYKLIQDDDEYTLIKNDYVIHQANYEVGVSETELNDDDPTIEYLNNKH